MNKCYRIIWSRVRQAYVVVGELARSAGKTSRRTLLDATAVILFAGSASLLAAPLPNILPTGGQIHSGVGSISSSDNLMLIEQQSQQLITHWQSFNIGSQAGVRFIQPSSSSIALNRVTGADPSRLFGQLQANGRVYLVNPNGILIGPNARINTAEFLASALDVSDEDFLNGGEMSFSGDSTQSVVNLGKITAENGDVILIAYQVRNEGEMEAKNGVAVLVAGNEIVYSPEGDQRILVKAAIDDAEGAVALGVENQGVITAAQVELKAAGGNIYELAINQSGIVRATGSKIENGRVLLTADDGFIQHSGIISASNADGSGGEVLIGGDYRGENAAIANAAKVLITEDAVIDVSAVGSIADGGRAIVWAEQSTRFYGKIEGQGGNSGGDGAFAEVSGKQMLDYKGHADLRANEGSNGTLLLDPASLTVQASGSDTNLSTSGTNPVTDKPSDTNSSILLVSTLESQLATSNVILDTSYVYDTSNSSADGSILVSDGVSWSSGNTLTFNSGNNITLNGSLNAGSGDIVFALGFVNDGAVFGGRTLTSDLTVDIGASVSARSVVIQRNIYASLQFSCTSSGPMGAVTFDGSLIVDTLDIQMNDEGISGAVQISNASNQIGILKSTGSFGNFESDFTVVDGSGDLFVDGSFTGGLGSVFMGGALSITTAGNLTLNSGVVLSTIDGFDIYLAAQSGSFTNNATASAIAPGGMSRFLVYSDDPANITKGGLSGDPVYNKTYSNNAPASITQTDNRFLYRLAPTLNFIADGVSREYGDANPTFTYTVSGLIAGDSAASVYSGVPTLATTLTQTSNAGANTGAITVSQGSVTLSDFDYTYAGVAGDLGITQALLTVTPNAATRLYGDVDPVFSGSYTGFKNSDTDADIATFPDFVSNALSGSNIGNYDITGSGGADINYSFAFNAGTNLLSVTAAPLTITANADTRVYGASNPSFSASFSGLKDNDSSADFPVLGFSTPDSTTSSGVATNAYIIRPSGATNTNYTYDYTDGSLSITPANLAVVADNAAHVFDGSVPDPSTYSAVFRGLVAGDLSTTYTSQLVFSNTTTGATTGSFDINVSGVSDPNYNVIFTPGTLTISNQILTVAANDFSRLYGSVNPDFTSVISGYVGSDDSSVLLTPVTYSTLADINADIGTYSIIPAGATATDYDFSFVNGTLMIDPALLSIRADDALRLYGATNPTFTASYTGLVASDVASDITGISFTSDAVTSSNVGSGYTITPANASNSNYVITFETASLTVTAAPLTITANDKTRLYGASDPAFDAVIGGLVAGDTSADIFGLTLATDALITSNVGLSYLITPSGATNTNYAITYAQGALAITPAPLIIAPDDMSRLFGDDNPVFTAQISGLVAGDQLTDLSVNTIVTSASSTSNVGSYAITGSNGVNGNYDISFTPGSLTVNQRPLRVIADDKSSVFGDTLPAYTYRFNNLASFHSATDITGLSLVGPTGTLNDVGSYLLALSGGVNSNYVITRIDGNLDITRRSATVTVLDSSREYGESNPGFNVAIANQVTGAAVGTSGLIFTTSAQSASNVSNYKVVPSGISNGNYDLIFVDGVLAVTPAPLTYNAVGASRQYGLANPVFTYNDATGYKLNDGLNDVLANISLTTTATEASNIGNYAIDLAADVINSNYTVGFNDATLSVFKAQLFVVPALSTRLYGDPDPAFTISATGLLNGDTESVVTNAFFFNSNSPLVGVGSYPIQLFNANALNYELTFGTGTMNVLPRPLTIRANDASREYGDENPAFSASFLGLASFDLESVIPDVFVSTVATATSNVLPGGYGLSVSAGSNRNYNISTEQGRLFITPVSLSVFVEDATRQYATANPSFSGEVLSGFKLSDDIDDLFLKFETSAEPTSDVGSYPIYATSGNPNYDFMRLSGTLNITPAPLIALIDLKFSQDRAYGDANVDFSDALIVGGLQFGAQVVDVLNVINPTFASTPIGKYALEASVISPNYELQSFANNEFFIQQRKIDLVFSGAHRMYGEELGNLFSFLDTTNLFAPGDTPENVFAPATTDTNIASNVGEYPISTSSINSNYGINSVTGNLTINPRLLAIDFEQLDRVYGEPNPENLDSFRLQGQPFDLLPFDPLNTILNITLPPQNAAVGEYSMAAEVISNNYQLVSFNGSMKVTPRTLFLQLPEGYERNYGDKNPDLEFAIIGVSDVPGFGLASFDTLADAASLLLPDEQADIGIYNIIPSVSPNYSVVFGEELVVSINQRPIELDLSRLIRPYGESPPNRPLKLILVGGSGLPSFAELEDVIGTLLPGKKEDEKLPGKRADVGTYAFIISENPNYQITYPVGKDIVIRPRTLDIQGDTIFSTYGDTGFSFVKVGGDGFADFESPTEQLILSMPTEIDLFSPAGYYPISGYTLLNDANYEVTGFSPSVFTVFPRQITLNIKNQTLEFDDLGMLKDFFIDQNRVYEATVGNLAGAEIMDDAFPIIRYQVVETNAAPQLPTIPTLDNILIPDLLELVNDPGLIGKGVVLNPDAVILASSGVAPTPSVFSSVKNGRIDGFITLFDGFDTEENYVLTGVTNGSISLVLPIVIVQIVAVDLTSIVPDAAPETVSNVTFSLSNLVPKTDSSIPPENLSNIDDPLSSYTLQESLTFKPSNTKLVVTTEKPKPQSVLSFFDSRNSEILADMILGFADENLLTEIKLAIGAVEVELTPFHIKRWFKLNQDNPAAMALLAEPLANYSKAFLNKDPSTYTKSEGKFARLLANHMENARDDLAAKAKEKHDAWVSDTARNNLVSLFGIDVPWSDFIADAVGDYISEDLPAQIAGTVIGAAVGGTAAGGIMIGMTAVILPYAVTGGASIAAGAAVANAGVLGVVAFPVAVVAAVIVGSVARGIQILDAEEQKQIYDSIQAGVGSSITVRVFSLTDSKGNDNALNQTILLGAMASMLFAD